MKALVQPLSSVPPKRGVSLPALAQEASALAELGVMARETLGDRVTAELRKLLVAGRLAPGDKLSLRKVAEAVGVSMMPVREAVSRLAADGALEVLPGRAVRVPVMSLAQFRELTRIRLVVEGFAAEEAARRATPEAIGEIARFEAAFRAVAVADVPDASVAVSANHDFHFAVYRASGMPSLVEMIERLWLKAGPVLNLDMRSERNRLKGGSAMQAHAALLAALKTRDVAVAREALQADIGSAALHIEGTGRLRAE